MKKIDTYGLKLCNFQAELFQKSLNETTCSSKIFIRRFMLSDLAKRMDSEGFLFDAIDVTDALCEIEEQFGPIQPENQVNRFIKSSNRMNYKNYTSLTTL